MYNSKKSIRQLNLDSVRNTNIILAAKVLEVHDNPFVRIFRVIGGFSIMAVLLNIMTVFLEIQPFFIYPFDLIVLFIALFHIIYIISFNFIKISYKIKFIKRNDAFIRRLCESPNIDVYDSPEALKADMEALKADMEALKKKLDEERKKVK